MKLIGLLVLLALVSLVEGEVVKSFDSCHQFFVRDQNGKPVTPTVLVGAQYRHICQKYKRTYRFATLYDTQNRIPVYSAYLFTGSTSIPREGIAWKIEPQLDHPNLDDNSEAWKNMAEMTTKGSQTRNRICGKYQALDIDYSGRYQRGHLYPHCHNCDQNQAESTFTLTNAAPQEAEDNQDWYGQVEKVTNNIIYNQCQKTVYVVTGVVPGDKWIGYDGKNRVNVPSYFWSAFCCKHREEKYYLSVGFLAPTNIPDRKMVADRMSVEELNNKLSGLYAFHDFKVFGDVCK